MYRIACLRIPRFQIVVHQKAEPALKKCALALIARRSATAFADLNSSAKRINVARAKVFMCSTEAAKKNVLPGMRLSEARAECAELIWRECDEKQYRNAEHQLLNELIACSPRVSVHQPGIFLLDASGLERLGGENKLCRDVLKLVSRCGFVEGQIGVADSAFAALVATRCKTKRWFVVPPGGDRSFLSPLTINHLPISSDLRELLRELGIHKMGQIAKLPPDDVLSRFGADGKFMHDLVHGIDKSQPKLPRIERKFQTSIEIGGPVESLNDTLFLFKSMLDRLSIELKQQMLCADELTVLFYNDNEKFDERKIQLIKPSNGSKFLVEVIRLTLESKPLSREFTALDVSVSSTCKESWEQPRFEITAAALNVVNEQDPMQSENAMLLLQRFRARVGENVLLSPAPSDEYFADKAGVWLPVLKSKRDANGGFEALSDSAASQEITLNTVQPIPVNRNYIVERTGLNGLGNNLVLRRITPAEPVLVRLDENSQPTAVTRFGQWHKIVKITSPECLSGHWWEATVRKSYYSALIEKDKRTGLLFVSLVFDAETSNWAIDGVFD